MRIPVLSVATLLAATPVLAQTAPETPPGLGPTPPPAAAAATSSGPSGAGGRAGIGVGLAANLLNTVGGPSIAYEGGLFHLDSALLLQQRRSGDKVDFGLMARFWWHLHAMQTADFSIGGGVAYRHIGPGNSDGLWIEPGAQFRVFIVPNVAVNGTLGVSIATADASGFALTASQFATVGAHYYFF